MAKFEGIIEKINNKDIFINGKKYTTAKNESLKKGDYIAGNENGGKIVNFKKTEPPQSKSIQNPHAENAIINKITETNKKEDKIELTKTPKKETKKIISNVVKTSITENEIDIIKLIDIEKIFNNTEKIDTLIKNIDLNEISKAQFSAFENELEKINFNFHSNDIEKFIDERIKRDKASKFYRSFKSEILDNVQELEAQFELGELEQKYKNKFNRKFFEYLKKYYRYTLVLKDKENSSKGE